MLRAYICGPLRGDVESNRDAAARAVKKLLRLGYAVFCPHTQFYPCDCGTFEREIMECCLYEIVRSDIVVLLDGWEKSLGSQREIAHIRSKCPTMPIEHIDSIRGGV